MSVNPLARRWPVLVWLVLSQLVYLILFFPWMMASMMSVMAFDSGVNIYNTLFVGVLWSYPIWPILFSISAWVSFARGKDKNASILTAVPLLLIILAVVLFLTLTGLGF